MATADATLLVSLNGGGASSGEISASVGDTVQLSAANKAGWRLPAPRWEIYDYPPDFTEPAGWSTDGTTGAYYVTGSADPPSFVADEWGIYAFALTVNGHVVNVDTFLVVASPNGLNEVALPNYTQLTDALAYLQTLVARLNASIRQVDALAGLVSTDVKTAAYTPQAGELIPYDTSGGTFPLNLPAVADFVGAGFAVWNEGGAADACVLTRNGSDTIDGVGANRSLTTTGVTARWTVIPDRANGGWVVFGPG